MLLAVAAFGSGAKVAGDRSVRRFEHLDLEEVAPPGKVIDVEDLRLHYEEAGEGEAVILLHGLGASTFGYRFLLPALAPCYRVIALDLPGFGYSTRHAPDMSMSAEARYLKGFMERLRIERAVLVGHSMGGAIAQRFAMEEPGRVEKLVLISPASHAQLQRARALSWLAAPFVSTFSAIVFHRPKVRRLWLSLGVHDRAFLTPELIARYSLPSRMRGHNSALRRWLVDRRKDRPLDPSRLSCPTLIIWGESDHLLRPTGGTRLQEQIPGSRLVRVKRAGHLVAEEQPDVVNRLLLDFLQGEPAAKSSSKAARRLEDSIEGSEGKDASAGRA
jgi:pimeloyl-ACP methyl ester carboxylesterase